MSHQIKLAPKEFAEDVATLLDCFTGADGGVAFVILCRFLNTCVDQGNDVPFLRQTAKLIRKLAPDL